jgi:ADP-ribosyl-[dinitrogen reductase] hydrolase
MSSNKVRDALFGVAVGDAVGVPAEFKSRKFLADNPVKGNRLRYSLHAARNMVG